MIDFNQGVIIKKKKNKSCNGKIGQLVEVKICH